MGLYPERGKSHSVGAIRKPRAVLPRLPRSRKNTAVGALLAIQELTRRKSNSVETLINDLAKGAYGSEQKAAKCVQRENTGKTAAWTVLIKKVPKLDQLKDGRNHQSELQRKLKKRLRTENSRPTPPPPPKKRRGTRGRSVLDAHSTTPVPKKSSSKKRGPKPNQVHKGFLTFAGILDIIEYMSGSRDKENYLARQRHLQRKYGRATSTFRLIRAGETKKGQGCLMEQKMGQQATKDTVAEESKRALIAAEVPRAKRRRLVSSADTAHACGQKNNCTAPTASSSSPAPAQAQREEADRKQNRRGEARSSPKEKRAARWRSKANAKTRDRIARAQSQRLFLVAEHSADEHSRHYAVMGSTGNIYDIDIGRLPSCSCPDFRKGNLCKHVLFVYLKVLKVPTPSPRSSTNVRF